MTFYSEKSFDETILEFYLTISSLPIRYRYKGGCASVHLKNLV